MSLYVIVTTKLFAETSLVAVVAIFIVHLSDAIIIPDFGANALVVELSVSVKQLLSVIENWFALCLSCVKWGKATSYFYKLTTGVRQVVLSPCLFGIFIDDLVKIVNKAHCGCRIGACCAAIFMYADDIIATTPAGSDGSISGPAVWRISRSWVVVRPVCRKSMVAQYYRLTVCQFTDDHVVITSGYLQQYSQFNSSIAHHSSSSHESSHESITTELTLTNQRRILPLCN